MENNNRILIVIEDTANSLLLSRILTKSNYIVEVSNNDDDAYKRIEQNQFDAIITNWKKPNINGNELISRIRSNIKPLPLFLMLIELFSEESRNYSLSSGADDFLTMPINLGELLTRIEDGLQRKNQESPKNVRPVFTRNTSLRPAFPAIAIASGSGGSQTIIEIFKSIPDSINAAFYIVQHGPSWLLDIFTQKLQMVTELKVDLAINGETSQPGNIYVAPADKHMLVERSSLKMIIDEAPKHNFVRPAADHLFESAADAFGHFCTAVILTGLGRDGAKGAGIISSVNGTVLVQRPDTAVSACMPDTLIESGIEHELVDIKELGRAIKNKIKDMNHKLKEKAI